MRARGALVELEGEVPDDVHDALAGLRERPRFLVPRAETSVPIERIG